MKLAIVVGNPKPQSRTFSVAETVAQELVSATGATISITVDLCEYSDCLFLWPDAELDEVAAAVASSDMAVIATPTYKAAYTGLLKAFLDRYPENGLGGVMAIPVMTGGSPAHQMAIDTSLRPLLVELGASVPTGGLYFLIEQFDDMDAVVGAWASTNLPLLQSLVPVDTPTEER